MDILIRNLSEVLTKKIDEQAKEKGVSREAFLKEELEKIAYKKESTELEGKYQDLVNELSKNLKRYGQIMKDFMDEFILDIEDAYFLDKEIDSIKEIKNEIPDCKLGTGNLTIRYVPEDVFIKISELSEKRGISKNEFMNRYLKQLTYSDAEKIIDTKYEYLVNKTLGVLEYTNRVLDLFYEENVID